MQLIMEDQENNNTINRTHNTRQRTRTYRNLLNQIEEIHESNDVGLHTVKKLKDIISEANLLNDQCDIREKVMCPEEILLDSFVLSSASNILVKCTKAVDVLAADYEPLEFASKIVDTIKVNETVEQLDLLKLLDDARDIIPNVIECSFLYGTYDMSKIPEPKEKKERIKQSQQPVQKKELVAVKNTQNDNNESDENDETVMMLLKILQNVYNKNGERPLKYYDFIIDTNSYSTTIENIFYCSFLIRDGRAKLELDEVGVPIIKPSNKKDLKLFRQNSGANIQTIVSIDMEEWNRLKSREGYIQRHRKSLE